MSGRRTDVLIEDWIYTNPRTGVEVTSDESFYVWADAGLSKLIEGVEGVTQATPDLAKTRYHVWIDKRYDIAYIKREIEAAILCRDGGK